MFHLCKQSRIYNGSPYCGPTSGYIPAEYETKEQAIEAQIEFTNKNPVGWNIFDSVTGNLIDGYDFFKE